MIVPISVPFSVQQPAVWQKTENNKAQAIGKG